MVATSPFGSNFNAGLFAAPKPQPAAPALPGIAYELPPVESLFLAKPRGIDAVLNDSIHGVGGRLNSIASAVIEPAGPTASASEKSEPSRMAAPASEASSVFGKIGDFGQAALLNMFAASAGGGIEKPRQMAANDTHVHEGALMNFAPTVATAQGVQRSTGAALA